MTEVPFGANGHPARFSVVRMIEALIIGVVTGALAGGVAIYGTQLVFGEQLRSVGQQLSELKADVRKIRDDFYVPRMSQTDRRP